MSNVFVPTRPVRAHPVRGRIAHHLVTPNCPTDGRFTAKRPSVREATVWLFSAHHCQHSSQPSSLVLFQTISCYHYLPLTFGRR